MEALSHPNGFGKSKGRKSPLAAKGSQGSSTSESMEGSAAPQAALQAGLQHSLDPRKALFQAPHGFPGLPGLI